MSTWHNLQLGRIKSGNGNGLQAELRERLLDRCDSIEKAAEYVDAETNTISPLWAVMDKTKGVAS